MSQPKDQIPNEILVLRAQLGDREALVALVRRWEQPLWSFLRHHGLGVGETDDLTQDVWLAVLRSLAGLDNPGRFAPWLFTVARRTVSDQLRRRYRRPPGPLPMEEATETVDEDFTARIVNTTIAEQALTELDKRDRLAAWLHYLNDISIRDCAEILDVAPGTVKSRLARARRLLRPALTDHHDE